MLRSLQKITYSFSRKSARDMVPKILKDPKFTSEGINRKKPQNYIYDLTQEHIPAEKKHLYYNHQEAKKQNKERRKQNKILNSPYEIIEKIENQRDPNLMLQELFDQELLQKPSRRIINNILQLEKNKVSNEDLIERQQIYGNSLQEVASQNLKRYNFRDFGIFVHLCSKYQQNSVEVWRQIILNYLRAVEKKEYLNESYLTNQQQQKQLSNFIFVYNYCYKFSQKFENELAQEQKLLQKASKEYFQDKFQEIPDMNQRALFLATLSKTLDTQNDKNVQDFIQISVFNHIEVKKLNLQSLLAITHMLYKSKLQITTELYQQIEKQFLAIANKETVSQSVFSIYLLSVGNILNGVKNYSPEFQQFQQNYLEKTEITSLRDVAFILEGLKKLRMVQKPVLDKFEGIIQNELKNNQNNSNNKIQQQQSYRVWAQILRGCTNNHNRFSEQTIRDIVEQIDLQNAQIKKSDHQMLKKLLNNFSAFVDLESLKLAKVILHAKNTSTQANNNVNNI